MAKTRSEPTSISTPVIIMVTVLDVLTWVAGVAGFVVLTVGLAGSLYYLAELVEEYTVATRKVIRGTIYVVLGFNVALLVLDGFPWQQTAVSVVAHGVYMLLLKEFPFIQLTSPAFIASCLLTVVNHFLWFTYFSNVYYRFAQVAAFFALCVWVVPFMFFISLSASDNTLPSVDATVTDQQRRNRIGNRVLSVFHMFFNRTEGILPSSSTSRNKDF